jgi:hypothetical protein
MQHQPNQSFKVKETISISCSKLKEILKSKEEFKSFFFEARAVSFLYENKEGTFLGEGGNGDLSSKRKSER